MKKFTSKIKLVLIFIVFFALLDILAILFLHLVKINNVYIWQVGFDIGTSLFEILLVFFAFSSGKKLILKYRKEKTHFIHLIDLLPEAIYVHREGNLLFSNKAGATLFGSKSNEDLLKHNLKEFIYNDTNPLEHFLKEELTNGKEQVLNYQIRVKRLDGQGIDLEITSTNVEFNGLPAREIIARDISFKKQQEGMVKKLAYQDALTELPNRRAFMEQLEQQLVCSEKFAVMFIDLDGFKNVNDTLGHKAGDDLLKKVSIQLTNCVREKDMVARLAGDEFTILLPDVNQQDCVAVASRIIKSLNMSISLPGKDVRITASVGISLYPQNGEDAFMLLKHADMAMYHAKNKGKNRYEFTNLLTAV